MALDARLAKKLDDCAATLDRVCRDRRAPGKRFVAELRERCGSARSLRVRWGARVHEIKVADIRISRTSITLGPVTLCAIGIDTMIVDEEPADETSGRSVYCVRDDDHDDVHLELLAA